MSASHLLLTMRRVRSPERRLCLPGVVMVMAPTSVGGPLTESNRRPPSLHGDNRPSPTEARDHALVGPAGDACAPGRYLYSGRSRLDPERDRDREGRKWPQSDVKLVLRGDTKLGMRFR